jgi:hypothetical protein
LGLKIDHVFYLGKEGEKRDSGEIKSQPIRGAMDKFGFYHAQPAAAAQDPQDTGKNIPFVTLFAAADATIYSFLL